MISVFLQEQKRYKKGDLSDKFKSSEKEKKECGCFDCLLKKLEKHNVLKKVKQNDKQKAFTDLQAEDIETADDEAGENKYYYVFIFVGVIIIGEYTLMCYPKYLFGADEPMKEMKQIFRVLEKYKNSKKEDLLAYDNTDDSSSFNKISVMLFLLRDYFENGVYIVHRDIIETNGSDEILWDRTINETFAIVSNNRPYYPELLTKKRMNDELDYFRRLHECILSECSATLENFGLLGMLGLPPVKLSEESMVDFGEIDYILNRIRKEIHVQFNTRKQNVLKALYAYMVNKNSVDDPEFCTYGTNSFNLVWEAVCAEVLGNRLDTELDKLPHAIAEKYKNGNKQSKKLIDLIDTPQWNGIHADQTLTPDIISIEEIDGKCHFIIFDAKYYNVQFVDNKYPVSLPGIDSITKQYLYELAYRNFIDDHDIKVVKNCFLFPTAEEKVIDGKAVSLDMLKKLNLQDIQVRLLPAEEMYKHYINGTKKTISELMLD